MNTKETPVLAILLVLMTLEAAAFGQNSGDYAVQRWVTDAGDEQFRQDVLAEIEINFGTPTKTLLDGATSPNSGTIGWAKLMSSAQPAVHDRTTVAVRHDLPAWFIAIAVVHEYNHIQNIPAIPPGQTSATPYDKDPSTDPSIDECADCNHRDMRVNDLVELIRRACKEPHPSHDEWCRLWKKTKASAQGSHDACESSNCSQSNGPSGESLLDKIDQARAAAGVTCPGYSCS